MATQIMPAATIFGNNNDMSNAQTAPRERLNRVPFADLFQRWGGKAAIIGVKGDNTERRNAREDSFLGTRYYIEFKPRNVSVNGRTGRVMPQLWLSDDLNEEIENGDTTAMKVIAEAIAGKGDFICVSNTEWDATMHRSNREIIATAKDFNALLDAELASLNGDDTTVIEEPEAAVVVGGGDENDPF